MKRVFKKLMSLTMIFTILMFGTVCFADPLNPNPKTAKMTSPPTTSVSVVEFIDQ